MGDAGLTDLTELMQFQARQQVAWDSMWKYRYTLYGGARGGGKSYLLRRALLGLLLYYPSIGLKNVMVGLFCDTWENLRDRQIAKIRSEFPDWLGKTNKTDTYGLAFHLRPEYGGGIMALRNLGDDPTKYKSAEFAAIGWDEVTLSANREVFDILRGSLRWPGIEHCPLLGASNPDGPGNVWVRKYWIERDFPPELQAMGDQFNFVPALPSDNKYLSKSYWDELNSQPEERRRAWLNGDWYVFAGQAVKFRYDQHVVAPFEIPEHWIRVRGIDWGFSQPMCCLWVAKNPDNGRVVVYRELYEKELTDRQQARIVSEMTPPGENIRTSYADPSMWARKTQTDIITSTADVYRENGVYLTQANNNRLAGKRTLDRMLEPLPDGLPGLLVFENCTNVIRTLPGLVYDKVHAEDIDTRQEDHAYDALRYSLTNHREVSALEVRRAVAKSKNPWYAVRDI